MDIATTLFPAIATVTAAFVAGGVAFLSSVLSKEQKTSEFRYAWLNSVLDDIAKFTALAESFRTSTSARFRAGDTEGTQSSSVEVDARNSEMLAAYYRARIRLYPQQHLQVLQALERLKTLVVSANPHTPEELDTLIVAIVESSHNALKSEWGRVKRGELTFRLTKYIALAVLVIAVVIAALWAAGP